MNWYYVEQGQQKGPVEEAQMAQLSQAGKINADTLVWHEGLPDWIPYGQAKPSQPPAPAAQMSPPLAIPTEGEVVCAECGKLFPASETVRFGKASVCAACKPVFLQKLSEGARVNTGEFEYASVLTRFAAVFLDGILVGIVNLATNFGIGLLWGVAARPENGQPSAAFFALQAVLFACNMTTGALYEGIMFGKYGATLGKMACKIKVVTADGGNVSFARAFGRYFAKLLSAFTCMIGYLIAFFDDQKRALHDHLCSTRVVVNR